MDSLLNLANTTAHGGSPLNILIGLTLLGVAPFLLVMMTSFIRIIVVFSLVRQAMGTQSLPPNVVLTGLALIMTFLIMTPAITKITNTAITPYNQGHISQHQMVDRAIVPLQDFMIRQTREKDIVMFMRIGHLKAKSHKDVPLVALVPAFVVGELRAAFTIGFALYLPFLAIDLAVASILMSLGMMMLSPPIISLPCKLLLFVMVDGWTLVCGGIASSFR
jgi:flagellar biosynthetic protein FliP